MESDHPTPEDILGKAVANPEVVAGAAHDAGKTEFPEVRLTEEEKKRLKERSFHESTLKMEEKDPLRGDHREKYTPEEIEDLMEEWDRQYEEKIAEDVAKKARNADTTKKVDAEDEEDIPVIEGEFVDIDDESQETVENEQKETKIWYPELKKDMDDATRRVHIWKDGLDHSKGKRDAAVIERDEKKVQEAIGKLKNHGINIKPFSVNTRAVWQAKRIVFDGQDPFVKPNDLTEDQAVKMLNAMGIDVDKVVEEREKDNAAGSGRPPRPDATPPEPPVDPRRPAARSAERAENKENIGDYIKKNEVALNELLLQGWDPLLAINPDRDMLAKMVDLSQSIHRDNLLDRYRAKDGSVYADMFKVAQDLYLKKILGESDYVKIVGTSDSIKKQESADRVINTDQRQRFEQILTQLVARTFLSEARRWFEYPEGSEMKGRLEKYLVDRFNKSEIDTDESDTGVVVRFLGKAYLQGDEIRGTQEIRIAKEPNAEILRQMIKIHDLTVVMDAPTFRSVEGIGRPELLQSVDEALISMLSLEKDGTAIVPLVIQEYDDVMRSLYAARGSEINIDDETVRGIVAGRLGGVFDNPEEVAMFLKMGRDVCCLTGINAQYGYPVKVETRVTSGLTATVKGAFLRGLLNYNKSLITYGTDTDLTGGINLAVVPFWNKLRGDEMIGGRKAKETLGSAPIAAGDISSLVENKMKGNANYEAWFGALKGPTEAKKTEGEFMNGQPTLENFVTKVMPAYFGYLQFTPDKGKAYFFRRLDSCIPYFLTKGERKERLKISIVNLFMKDGNFDGKGLFEDANELKKYFTDRGVNTDIDPVKIKERRDIAYEAGRNGDIVGLFKSIFKK